MLGIGIGVQEGESDAFHFLRAQFGHQCTHGGFVERQPHGALCVDALGDRETQGARRQRFRLVDRKVVLIVAALGTDIEHIAETLRCDKRRLRSAALNDGVGRERRAVNEDVDIAYVGARIGQNETHPVQHRLLRSRGRRQHLARSAILTHIQDDIRERASDIDGKPHFGSLKHSKTSACWPTNCSQMFSNFHAIDCARGDMPSYFAGYLCSAPSTNSRCLVQQLQPHLADFVEKLGC